MSPPRRRASPLAFRNPGVDLTGPRLIAAAWGPSWGGYGHPVDVHIGHLCRTPGD